MRTTHAKAAFSALFCLTTLAGSIAAAEPASVKLGVLTDMNGVFSELGGRGSVIATQMAIEDFKKASKPAFSIELVTADHQNKADIGASKAREWYDAQNVDAIFDAINSSVALAVSNVTRQKNKVLMVTGAGSMRLTNEECSPNTIGYTWDTYSASRPQVAALTKNGIDSWYFITVDYTLGQSIEAEARQAIEAAGGKVVGAVKHPLSAPDFSSYMLQAQASQAKGVAIASAGVDATNAIKAAREFGVTKRKVVAPISVAISDIHAIGLEAAQGMITSDGFYWNLNPETRAWSQRFFAQHKRMPSLVQAGTYSGVLTYLQAVQAAGSKDSAKVLEQMKKSRINDIFAKDAYIRKDGRMVHDMYLVEIKKPQESKEPWDYYKIKAVIPGDQAFQPLSESRCPLVKGS